MCKSDCSTLPDETKVSDGRSLFHIRVSADAFGNAPTVAELTTIGGLFERALKADGDSVVVTSDRVIVDEYRV